MGVWVVPGGGPHEWPIPPQSQWQLARLGNNAANFLLIVPHQWRSSGEKKSPKLNFLNVKSAGGSAN